MTLAELREHPNFSRLKKSVEFAHLKKETLILGGFLGVWSLFMILALLVSDLDAVINGAKGAKLVVSLMLWFFMLVGFAGYYGFRFVELFSHLDRYTFSEALMDKPHQGYKGSMYFTVQVMDRSGNLRSKDTRAIFSQGEPNFEDYLNKKVLVGYNDESDIVVVIGKTVQ